MNRRTFVSRFAQTGIVSTTLSKQWPALLAQTLTAQHKLALPSADQVAWQNLEMVVFVHFAPNTWQDVESDNLSTPLSKINPEKLNTDQWAQTALNLGAKYIVFVAKHQGGFCMWQTHTTDYSIRNTPWKGGHGDVLAEIAASCHKYGLKLGVYVCPRDDHFGAKTGGICATPELQAKYDKMYREQLTEVFSRYGKLVEIWFDGSTATPVADILAKYQPHAMVFQGPQATIRWVGNEDGFAPNPLWNAIDKADARSGTSTSLNSDFDGDTWLPCEVDVSIRRPDWFWSTKNENKVLTESQLLSIYYCSVGRGAQLLLNIPANRDGLLADKDCGVAKAFGSEIRRRFGKPLAETAGTGKTVTLRLPKPTQIDTVILEEDIAKGQRVREYILEGHSNGRWQNIGVGTSIGHKRIQPVASTTVDAVRLTATEAAALPAIRSIAVFDIGVAPPTDWNATPRIWAANDVGSWHDNAFSLDLTKKIDAAKQYRLRFIPKNGNASALKDVVLKLHGVSEPRLIKSVPGKPNELILDITGVDETVQVTGRVEGASTGQILLQKL
jgi:alpha-L-fucosidase